MHSPMAQGGWGRGPTGQAPRPVPALLMGSTEGLALGGAACLGEKCQPQGPATGHASSLQGEGPDRVQEGPARRSALALVWSAWPPRPTSYRPQPAPPKSALNAMTQLQCVWLHSEAARRGERAPTGCVGPGTVALGGRGGLVSAPGRGPHGLILGRAGPLPLVPHRTRTAPLDRAPGPRVG